MNPHLGDLSLAAELTELAAGGPTGVGGEPVTDDLLDGLSEGSREEAPNARG